MLYLLSDHLLSEPLPSSALKILCIHVRDPGIYISFRDCLPISKCSSCLHCFVPHLLRILCDGSKVIAAIF